VIHLTSSFGDLLNESTGNARRKIIEKRITFFISKLFSSLDYQTEK